MGLDQWAFSTPDTPDAEVGFLNKEGDNQEFHYWRKHPNLHGWMEQLYLERGGDAEEPFNGIPLRLTSEDLNALELDIKGLNLPHTTGFFFGSSNNDENEIKDDLLFIKESRAEIKSRKAVWYISSW